MKKQEKLDNSMEAVLARFNKLDENWPYDVNLPLTKEQEEAEGVVDLTDVSGGVGLMILGVGRSKKLHP
ncbi:MAG: hypothetical protein EPN61_11235 [Burkholderiaceae bacterium]|nr:MAG: hypothetical protein EPN61_11235 [Burkholderiaceae bacterium]